MRQTWVKGAPWSQRKTNMSLSGCYFKGRPICAFKQLCFSGRWEKRGRGSSRPFSAYRIYTCGPGRGDLAAVFQILRGISVQVACPFLSRLYLKSADSDWVFLLWTEAPILWRSDNKRSCIYGEAHWLGLFCLFIYDTLCLRPLYNAHRLAEFSPNQSKKAILDDLVKILHSVWNRILHWLIGNGFSR